MSPLVILKTSFSSLGASKLRSGLTVLGIVIGVAAVITLMAIGKGAEATITQRIEGLGTNLLFVGPETGKDGPATLTLDDANALIDPLFAPGVAAVAPELIVSGRIKAGREYARAEIRGITPDYEFVRNFEVSSGQFISSNHVATNAQVAVLGSDISETIFGFRDPVGQFIRLDGRQFNVIGVLKSKGGGGKGNEDRVVLVPITTTYYRLSSQRSSEGSILVQNINVQVKDVSLMDVKLKEGLSATAVVILREEKNVLLVPTQSIYGTYDKPTVQVWVEGKIEERAVKLGNTDDFWIVVLDGLTEGEKIITEVAEEDSKNPLSLLRKGLAGSARGKK